MVTYNKMSSRKHYLQSVPETRTFCERVQVNTVQHGSVKRMTNSTNFLRDNSQGFEIEFLFGVLGLFEDDHRSRNMNFVCNSVENYVYFSVETFHAHPLNLL